MGYYFAVVILVLIFNLIGKLFMINRVDQNFRLLAEGGYQRHAFNIINDRNLARELTQNLDLEQPVVGYSQPADFLTNFMHLSFTEDFGENVSRITTPIFLVADLVCSIIVMVIYGDPFLALTVFSAATLPYDRQDHKLPAPHQHHRRQPSPAPHEQGALPGWFDGSGLYCPGPV